MAQDVVVKESLTDAMVRDGALLVEKLDEAARRPHAAFWFYFPDANAWRLLLALPEVSTKGPREAYTAIQTALAELNPTSRELALEDIGVMPTDHPLVDVLRGAIKTGPTIERIRFGKNVINGHFIDDALIYRLM
jgi:hypothetical protein